MSDHDKIEMAVREHFPCLRLPLCEARDPFQVTHTRACPAGLRERARRVVKDVLAKMEKEKK